MFAFPALPGPRFLALSVLLFAIAACTSLGPSGVQPVQSPNDDRQYRLLTLDNQLQVLLISDPDTPKAAASLDVNVGSGDNPEGRGGLAHFLEHMLFLGTDKYPDPAEYEEFVTEHGGNRNAYTSFEHTNYFFDIDAPFLPEALDRFAQFFISPRFDAEYVDREKNAVEAEYQMGLKSDGRRGLDVLQEVMNPDHPYSQFAVGSLESLADRPGSTIRDELLAFYQRYYSANLMKLVVLGSESLDELQAMVEPMFSPVPNHSVVLPAIDAPILSPERLPQLVQLRPQATSRELQVLFPLPDYTAEYATKPLSYLGNLVGHEGHGSILAQLKAEGLAESLAAGAGLGWRGGSLFGVTIGLSERGVAEYPRVLQLVYAYIELLKREGPQHWIYDEQARIADLEFRFKEDGGVMSYVAALAAGMHSFGDRDVLRGPYMMTDYDEQLLADMLGELAPEQSLVILTDGGVATDRVSVHYGVPYAVHSVGEEEFARWTGAGTDPALALPARNEYEFVADDVSLVRVESQYTGHPAPQFEEGRKKIWFAQDDEFQLPKGATYINFRSPVGSASAAEAAAAVLYTEVLIDKVNVYTYPASLAGLNFNFYKHSQGISLRISGYDDKQQELLQRILDDIAAGGFDPARFDSIRRDMIRALENSRASPPSSQVMADLREVLLYGEWNEQALIAALQPMTLADLQDFAARFWAGADAEAMIYGNYRPQAVSVLATMLDTVLPAGPAQALAPVEVLQLGAGEELLYPVDVPHDDAVLAWYLQAAGNDWPDRAASALTAQIIKSGFFQQLRTEQQLGYIVSAFSWAPHEVPGLVMLIQSPVADAAALATAMDTFLKQVEGGLDDEQFARHRAALVNDIRRPDRNLWERAEFYWQSIARKQYAFDGRQQLVDAVEALDRAAWLDYFNRHFMDQRRSLQVVAPGKRGALPAGSQRRVDGIDTLQQGHDRYVLD